MKIKLGENLIQLLVKNCYSCCEYGEPLGKKNVGPLIIQRTVISPAWFLIFIQIHELEESIYP